MTLSEAIRLGALLKPQGHGELLTPDGQSCALGAAMDALGALSGDTIAPLTERWPMLLELPAPPCPACPAWRTRAHMGNDDLYDAIVTLNDDHRWTREQIADWVEQIETQHEPQPEVGKQNLTEALR